MKLVPIYTQIIPFIYLFNVAVTAPFLLTLSKT